MGFVFFFQKTNTFVDENQCMTSSLTVRDDPFSKIPFWCKFVFILRVGLSVNTVQIVHQFGHMGGKYHSFPPYTQVFVIFP